MSSSDPLCVACDKTTKVLVILRQVKELGIKSLMISHLVTTQYHCLG
jgi:hypothetical protein